MGSRRRLAAIMFTDVVGFTASAQADESGTLAHLRELNELVRPLFAPFGGREIKSTGDGSLVEFDSALKALECAIEIQQRLGEGKAKEPQTPMQLRIGIHVGDVEESEGDVYGDAVNVASRIVPLAQPGGISVSEHVYAHVRGKISYAFEKLGARNLKGVREPVDVYRVVLPGSAIDLRAPGPAVPRIAVLPFANISPDPHDEYFADGLTEELISVLSQFQGLQVIARTSVISYKTAPKPIAQIGTELGVTSVLEGSVRKAGDHLRITAQLIDVGSQGHIWANTFDRKLDDIFAVQAEVAERIASALKVKVGAAEEARLEDRPTVRPDSYLAYLQGRTLLHSRWSEANSRAALKQFELAVSIDPTNARAFSGLADATTLLGWDKRLGSREDWVRQSRAYAAHAIELDPALAEAHCSLAIIIWDDWDYAGAERELKRAISLNPSYSFAHRSYSFVLRDMGRVEEAIRETALALELDPQSISLLLEYVAFYSQLGQPDAVEPVIERLRGLAPESWEYYVARGWWYYAKSDFSSSLQQLERALEISPERGPRMGIAWIRALKGEQDPARKFFEQEERRTTGRPRDLEALAIGYAFLGDLDGAFRMMFEGAQDHTLGFQMIRCDPRLEPVRQDPRFSQVLKMMNLAEGSPASGP